MYSGQHNRPGTELGSLELVSGYDPPLEHPLHQKEVCPDRGQSLTLSEVLMHHMRKHIVPGPGWVIFECLDIFFLAQEACSECRKRLAFEVREDVYLKVCNVAEHLFTVKDLERAQQISVGSEPVWQRQHPIMRLENVSTVQNTCPFSVCNTT